MLSFSRKESLQEPLGLLECEKRIPANIYFCLSQIIANQFKSIPQHLFYVPIFSNNFIIVYRRSKQKESDEQRNNALWIFLHIIFSQVCLYYNFYEKYISKNTKPYLKDTCTINKL